MKNKHVTELLPGYLDQRLDTELRTKVEVHLGECALCTAELNEMKLLLAAFKEEEKVVPNARVRLNFLAQLEAEKQAVSKGIALSEKTSGSRTLWATVWKVAAGVALLITAFYLGKYQQRMALDHTMALMSQESLAIKETAMLSLMENKSASRRIQGVNLSEAFENPDKALIQALIDRMHHDENINVRLTAVEALGRFTSSDTVKEAFIAALKSEKDPAILIGIIETLVQIQEKKAIVPLQELLNREQLQPFVKEHIKSALPTII